MRKKLVFHLATMDKNAILKVKLKRGTVIFMKKIGSLTLIAITAILAIMAIMLYFINSHGDDIRNLGCNGKVTTVIEKNGTTKVVTEGGCEATR